MKIFFSSRSCAVCHWEGDERRVEKKIQHLWIWLWWEGGSVGCVLKLKMWKSSFLCIVWHGERDEMGSGKMRRIGNIFQWTLFTHEKRRRRNGSWGGCGLCELSEKHERLAQTSINYIFHLSFYFVFTFKVDIVDGLRCWTLLLGKVHFFLHIFHVSKPSGENFQSKSSMLAENFHLYMKFNFCQNCAIFKFVQLANKKNEKLKCRTQKIWRLWMFNIFFCDSFFPLTARVKLSHTPSIDFRWWDESTKAQHEENNTSN